jgi:tryptophan synthase alpha chain
MKKLKDLFKNKKNLLSIYFTAGYPKLEDTNCILLELEAAGADLVELGMPYSDPLADGPTIQASSTIALDNGMTLELLFEQLELAKRQVNIPIILMGYYNQILQYGVDAFLERAASLGVTGLILPDLPLAEYESQYQQLFEKYDLGISFLITPETSTARILEIDRLSRGFVYVVSSSATTGGRSSFSNNQLDYFERLQAMELKNPMLIGFGVHNKDTFDAACRYASGAIVGSAFIRALGEGTPIPKFVNQFY